MQKKSKQASVKDKVEFLEIITSKAPVRCMVIFMSLEGLEETYKDTFIEFHKLISVIGLTRNPNYVWGEVWDKFEGESDEDLNRELMSELAGLKARLLAGDEYPIGVKFMMVSLGVAALKLRSTASIYKACKARSTDDLLTSAQTKLRFPELYDLINDEGLRRDPNFKWGGSFLKGKDESMEEYHKTKIILLEVLLTRLKDLVNAG